MGVPVNPMNVALGKAAKIVRTFVEDYHEKLEEEHLFPRFEKAGKLTDLVTVLRMQHQQGRTLTDRIQQNASLQAMQSQGTKGKLAADLRSFNRMYSAHEAWEDTVLFPAFRKLVPSTEYSALGEDFEKREQQKFGQGGFEAYVEKVAQIERSLGIADLARYSPAL